MRVVYNAQVVPKIVTWLAGLPEGRFRWTGWASVVCIGNTVWVPGPSAGQFTLDHEEKHTHQYAQYGIVGYLVRWFYWTWKLGYAQNPFEVEANAYAREKASERVELWDWDSIWLPPAAPLVELSGPDPYAPLGARAVQIGERVNALGQTEFFDHATGEVY